MNIPAGSSKSDVPMCIATNCSWSLCFGLLFSSRFKYIYFSKSDIPMCIATFPMCIATNCSWSFVYWVIILQQVQVYLF